MNLWSQKYILDLLEYIKFDIVEVPLQKHEGQVPW